MAQILTFHAHAKCILTGEHAVLRGQPAIVLPLPQFSLQLSYQPSEQSLSADCIGEHGDSLLMMFWGTLKKAFEMVERDLSQAKGTLNIENHIPLCAGLGFSASLCVVIGQWFVSQRWLTEDKLFAFARDLEDKFHQESSGVDIAGVLASQPIYYRRLKSPKPLTINWEPNLYLTYSNHISVTAEAVDCVKKLMKQNKFEAQRLDIDMAESVALAKKALELKKEDGIEMLASSLNQAAQCYQKWGLVSNKLQSVMDELQAAGAIACKPTGAGFGGFVLSLWSKTPSIQSVSLELLPVYLTGQS